MTIEYYTSHQFPHYYKAVDWLQVTQRRRILQEDGDKNHEIIQSKEDKELGIENIATQLKHDNWIETLKYSAQSPDLNSIEGVWNLLNERVHQRH